MLLMYLLFAPLLPVHISYAVQYMFYILFDESTSNASCVSETMSSYLRFGSTSLFESIPTRDRIDPFTLLHTVFNLKFRTTGLHGSSCVS